MSACRYCGFAGNEEVVEEVAASMHLVHWGLMTAERSCSLEERLEHYGCPYDKVLQHTSAVAAGPEQHADLYPRAALPCFVPEKDTVIASSALEGIQPDYPKLQVGMVSS